MQSCSAGWAGKQADGAYLPRANQTTESQGKQSRLEQTI